jgi:hypothetical protein
VTGDLPATLLPREESGDGYEAIVLDLGRQGHIHTTRSELVFEGGDVIVGARHVFVGEAVIRGNMEYLETTRHNVLELLEAEFGKPVLEITAPSVSTDIRRAPLSFHIDLSLAVARNRINGQEVALLNSPRLLFQLLLGVTDFENLTAKDLRARIAALTPTTDEEEEMLRRLRSIPLERHKLHQARLDFVAQRVLAPAGYSIIPVPGINDCQESADNSYYRSYTNAVFSGDMVALPHLDVETLDDYAKNALQSLGYRVLPMRSAPLLYRLQGGPRCALETYRKPQL